MHRAQGVVLLLLRLRVDSWELQVLSQQGRLQVLGQRVQDGFGRRLFSAACMWQLWLAVLVLLVVVRLRAVHQFA